MDSLFFPPPKCKPHTLQVRGGIFLGSMALKCSSASLSECLYPRTFVLWWKTAYGVSFCGKTIHV